eukprot:scaffold3150_cov51-Attheya_sp.AAC.19
MIGTVYWNVQCMVTGRRHISTIPTCSSYIKVDISTVLQAGHTGNRVTTRFKLLLLVRIEPLRTWYRYPGTYRYVGYPIKQRRQEPKVRRLEIRL